MILNQSEKETLKALGVDIDLSTAILEGFNNKKLGNSKPVIPKSVPPITGDPIIDIEGLENLNITENQWKTFKNSFPSIAPQWERDELNFTKNEISEIGSELFSVLSYGFLNGGSATSYGDTKKNKNLNQEVFNLYEKKFTEIAKKVRNRPKGVSPGFIQPDGSEGPSYMELKLRSVVLKILENKSENKSENLSFFQMSSVANDKELQKALDQYKTSPWLKDLPLDINNFINQGKTGVQPTITAYTSGSTGSKDFYRTNKTPSKFLPLPGGHGQCFYVLKPLWEDLYNRGYKFISIGNIDNLGYTPDALSLGLLALLGRPAGFYQSFKTPVDVKGGLLVIDEQDKLTCSDIGVGISQKQVEALEKEGKDLLFNCGVGIFNLKWLLENIDHIIENLPIRFSDQNKDIGEYSQAEQTTWEVIGMIENPIFFAIDKYKRFLASKMLLENMMTSGIYLDKIKKENKTLSQQEISVIEKLHNGLNNLLEKEYGLVLENNRWIPKEHSCPLDFDKGEGLIPVITQDAVSKEVLMQAYINKEAWEKTLETGEAVYFSRSRQRLWHKGEESGNTQKIIDIRVDCDRDSLLFLVEQVGGAACHTGRASCYYRQWDKGGFKIISKPLFDPKKVYNKN